LGEREKAGTDFRLGVMKADAISCSLSPRFGGRGLG
jgi:hypothetical protein